MKLGWSRPLGPRAVIALGLLFAAVAAPPTTPQDGDTRQKPAAAPGWWLAVNDGSGHRIVFDTTHDRTAIRELRTPTEISAAQFAALEASRNTGNAHHAPNGVQIGDAYDLLWNDQAVRVRIVSLFATAEEYEVLIGANVTADAAGEAKLQAAGGGPFFARKTSPEVAPATAGTGLFSAEISADMQAQMGALMTQRAVAVATDMLRKLNDPANPYNAWIPNFLASHPGAPRLAIQGVRLAGGAGERYFVRAEWRVNGNPAFVLGAWFKLQPEPAIVTVDLSAPEAEQSSIDAGGAPMGMDEAYPPILRVGDLGDGRTGIIRRVVCYECSGLEIGFYSDELGIVPTDVFVPSM